MGEIATVQAVRAVAVPGPQDADVLRAWESSLEVGPETRERYARRARAWAEWLEGRGSSLMAARRSDFAAWRDSLAGGGMRPGSVASMMTAARSLHGWMAAEGLRPDPTQGVRRPKVPRKGARAALTREQALAVASPMEGRRCSSIVELRDRAMANLMVRCGLRCVEVVRANVGDVVETPAGRAIMVQGKGRAAADEAVALLDSAWAPVDEYLSARFGEGPRDPAAPLFASASNRNGGGRLTARSVSRACKERMRAAGMDDAAHTAHSLRHTAATFALLEGGTSAIRDVQVMLRHADPATTERYAHDLAEVEGRAARLVEEYMAGD